MIHYNIWLNMLDRAIDTSPGGQVLLRPELTLLFNVNNRGSIINHLAILIQQSKVVSLKFWRGRRKYFIPGLFQEYVINNTNKILGKCVDMKQQTF